jgi:hypothetical protein
MRQASLAKLAGLAYCSLGRGAGGWQEDLKACRGSVFRQ